MGFGLLHGDDGRLRPCLGYPRPHASDSATPCLEGLARRQGRLRTPAMSALSGSDDRPPYNRALGKAGDYRWVDDLEALSFTEGQAQALTPMSPIGRQQTLLQRALERPFVAGSSWS